MSEQTFAMMRQEAELKVEIESLKEQKKPIEDQITKLRTMLQEIKEDRYEIEKQEAKVTQVTERKPKQGKEQKNKNKNDNGGDIYSKFIKKFKEMSEEDQQKVLRDLDDNE